MNNNLAVKEYITYHAIEEADKARVVDMNKQIAAAFANMRSDNARAVYDTFISSGKEADGIDYREEMIAGVKGWWCHSGNEIKEAAILYLHGGGYRLGSAKAYAKFAGHFSNALRMPAYVVDYRLAPEHIYPAAIEDCKLVYEGLQEKGFKTILLIGDSAGGGLVLSLSKILAETNTKQPTAVVAMSPWADLTLTSLSLITNAAADASLSKALLQSCVTDYAGNHTVTDPRISPVYGSFAALPPIQIHAGDAEILADDAKNFAHSAFINDCNIHLHIWQGMGHVFQSRLGLLRASDESFKIIVDFLKSKWKENMI